MSNKCPSSGGALASLASRILDHHKAEDIALIDLSGKTTFADYMVVASGTSQRHLRALAYYLQEELRKEGYDYVQIEGDEGSDWVLVDLGSVIVHLFRPETRQLYDLESMWDHQLVQSLRQKRG